MIRTRQQLQECLKIDAALYPKLNKNLFGYIKNCLVTNPINTQHKIWQYVRCLRYSEYYYNNSLFTSSHKKKNIIVTWNTVMTLWYFFRLRQLSYKTGIQIPPNTCAPGLQIWHYGYIIINQSVHIGRNITIYPGVEIGHKVIGGGCPLIGDDVFIGAGVKIFGAIKIGNNVTIAANAVVLHDIPDNAIVAGIPAKVVKYKK